MNKRLRQDYWHLEQEVVKRLLGDVPDGGCVLDVPFGTGRFVPYYLEKDMKVYGLDSSQDMLDVARRELKSQYANCMLTLGDATRLPYEDALFDLVVCIRFLCHVVSFDQAKATLRELHRVTNSKAILQFRVRKEGMPPVQKPLGDEPMNDRLTLEELTRLVNDSGFHVTRIELLEERDTYVRAVFACERE